MRTSGQLCKGLFMTEVSSYGQNFVHVFSTDMKSVLLYRFVCLFMNCGCGMS